MISDNNKCDVLVWKTASKLRDQWGVDKLMTGWAELAKPNIMILGAGFLNVGQRYAFAQPTLQVFGQTLTKAGNGAGTVTSIPAGISCGADCQEPYNSGTVVTLTATPATGSTFTGWSGDADCSDGKVTMSANKTCTATFRK